MINLEELLERAEQRRQQALDILGTLGLMEKWLSFGEPTIIGSIRYGLVVALDIDLAIFSDRL